MRLGLCEEDCGAEAHMGDRLVRTLLRDLLQIGGLLDGAIQAMA